MEPSETPEPDRAVGAPHPRMAELVIGHTDKEQEFLSAFASDRLHHAWLITGPEGIGKATLAWRAAKFLLTQSTETEAEIGLFGDTPAAPETLSVDENHPAVRRALAGAEPRLHVVRRSINDKSGKLSDDIRVDDVRSLQSFLALSAADGGYRVVIVDAADDMNVNAANALLKMLEEPPANVVFLIVSHQPGRLLPTIRSRCRTLRLSPLSSAELVEVLTSIDIMVESNASALHELCRGSVGTAVRLLNSEGPETYAEIVRTLHKAGQGVRPDWTALAESRRPGGGSDRVDMLFFIIQAFLTRLARTGAGHPPTSEAAPDEFDLLGRLSPSPSAGRTWATLQSELSERIAHGRAVNLDPVALILDTMFKINDTARQTTARA